MTMLWSKKFKKLKLSRNKFYLADAFRYDREGDWNKSSTTRDYEKDIQKAVHEVRKEHMEKSKTPDYVKKVPRGPFDAP